MAGCIAIVFCQNLEEETIIKGFQLILGKKTLSSRLMRYLAYAGIHTHCAVRPQCHVGLSCVKEQRSTMVVFQHLILKPL